MEEKQIPQGDSTPQNVPICTENWQWKSDSIEKLADALSKAQSEMKGAQKKSTNPFFKSNYADLHTCIEASFPHLTKYGLSVIQGNYADERGSFYVTTML